MFFKFCVFLKFFAFSKLLDYFRSEWFFLLWYNICFWKCQKPSELWGFSSLTRFYIVLEKSRFQKKVLWFCEISKNKISTCFLNFWDLFWNYKYSMFVPTENRQQFFSLSSQNNVAPWRLILVVDAFVSCSKCLSICERPDIFMIFEQQITVTGERIILTIFLRNLKSFWWIFWLD